MKTTIDFEEENNRIEEKITALRKKISTIADDLVDIGAALDPEAGANYEDLKLKLKQAEAAYIYESYRTWLNKDNEPNEIEKWDKFEEAQRDLRRAHNRLADIAALSEEGKPLLAPMRKLNDEWLELIIKQGALFHQRMNAAGK
jgi:hypothetical protein